MCVFQHAQAKDYAAVFIYQLMLFSKQDFLTQKNSNAQSVAVLLLVIRARDPAVIADRA